MLKTILANTYVLASKYQHYHWNITGPNFKPLHDFFGEQYSSLIEMIDDLAERIRSLDEEVEGSLTTYLKNTNLTLDLSDDAFSTLLHDYVQLIQYMQQAARDCEDLVTQDLIIEQLRHHEKTRWMLKAHIN